ncbi:MAG TPA: hypothetical protein VGY58_09545, partial [Gemmataceae bacterium]|nr:hypothetical protein [Gemmataceae bacterium]
MIGWTVSFWLAPSPKLPPREQKKWDKEIYRVIKPLVDSCTTLGDCEIDLDSPNLPELVGYFEDLRKKNVACLGCPEFKQRLMDDEHSRIEWFILDPKDQGEFDFSFDDLPTCKADRFKPGMDVAGFRTQLVVTERFKAVVEAHKLTGVEFVWMKDRSKYRAPQWYLPIAHEPLGRGLDHPWFDSTKMSGHGHASKDPRFRCGEEIVTSLGGYTLKSDAAFGDPVKDKLLALAKSMSDHRIERAKPVPRIVILACPIFLRDYLPET